MPMTRLMLTYPVVPILNRAVLAIVVLLLCSSKVIAAEETLPPLENDRAPQTFAEMWRGFDPRAEGLDVETLLEWEEEGVVLRIVRFRIGFFKGEPATLAAVYGFPRGASKLPGLLQIHGGGQFADYRACLMNAKRGYATVSIAWAGRISAPNYQVSSDEVLLFWNNKSDDPNYKLTTDWGAVDGYHAPSRNPGNLFPSAKAAEWTLDSIESPRNSGWFLCALAARRALTFLERQPEVDPERLGVYGHSMGGKLTVMTAVDPRVKAAAPSCGGISDRDNESPLFRSTLGDDVSLKQISCPILFLSPANDFHGRIGDLPNAIAEIQSRDWRITCSPHHNHQDTPPYEVATLLWFDEHLKGTLKLPRGPESEMNLRTADKIPTLTVTPDPARQIRSVDIYYTQQGLPNETPADREITMNRFWHHAQGVESDGIWKAQLPLSDTNRPLWAFANVLYQLDESVSGAGYYYGTYTTDSFNLSSLVIKVSSDDMKQAGVRETMQPSLLIESFEGEWEKEWFTYKLNEWSRSTHKLNDPIWQAPAGAMLTLDVRSDEPNLLVLMLDEYAAEVDLTGGDPWQTVRLAPSDFQDFSRESRTDWTSIKRLKLSPVERLTPPRRAAGESRIVGRNWKGANPQFRNLRWEATPVHSERQNEK